MKALCSTVVFTLIGISAAQWCMGGELLKSGLSRDLQVKILELHNSLRDKVAGGVIAAQPMAQNMKEMIWDQELTTRAQAWANKCIFQHEQDRTNKKGQLFGQNISQRDKTWSTDEGEWEVLSKMIAEWFDEVYKPHDSSHFSQMVWANTHKIGCGYSEYKNSGRVNAIFICNYFPSGNIIGKEPYAHGARSCEKHGLSASRSFRNLCAADDDSGLDNLHSSNQLDKGHQQYSFGQSGALEHDLQYARDHPVQLQSAVTSSPRNVQSKQVGRQFVQPIGPLLVPYFQVVPFQQYQANGIRGVPSTNQSQSSSYQDQYSSFTSFPRNVQFQQTGRLFVQPTNPLQAPNSQVAPFQQYQANSIRGAPPTDQSQSSSYQAQYSLSYLQQPQNTASFMLPSQYIQTNPIGFVPPYQTQTNSFHSLPTNVQGPPSIPDYQRFFQSKLPNYQSTPSTYQSNPTNLQTGQYQPTNMYGYSSAYQTPPTNFEGFLQKPRSDQQQGQLRLPTSDSSDPLRYGSNAQNVPFRGNDNLQWFYLSNPVGLSSNSFMPATMPQIGFTNSGPQMGFTNSGPQMGFTNSGFNVVIEPGLMYGNSLVLPTGNPTVSPMFGFESPMDPRSAVQYRNPLVLPVTDPMGYYNSGLSKLVDFSRGYDSSLGSPSGKPMGASFGTTIPAASTLGGAEANLSSRGQTYKQFSKPRYMRKH